ncbi:MAG: hypothetical protein LBO67_08400 [Spirochaetaceae bacterium]|jgi:hypothetical protein|nr:hypothetical protein [Spirochaetaceae bacterium]
MRTLRILFLLSMARALYAESPVSWTALWAGTFTEKNVTNRAEVRLFLPFELSVRAQVLDRRPPLWMDFTDGAAVFSCALYHKTTGSRLLYGSLDHAGLPARLRDPWIKSMPFVDYRKATGFDLKTDFSAAQPAQIALYLQSPEIVMPALHIKGFSGLVFESSAHPLISGGLEALFPRQSSLTVEGLYSGRTLAARPARAWFSEVIPLPERDFRLSAVSAAFDSPFFALAAEWAYAETFAFGRDSYANGSIRIGNRPWRLSFSAEGAGPRFVGTDGAAPGAGFRAGALFEYYGKRSALLHLGSTLRSPGIALPFERSTTQLYYRFPATKNFLQLSRLLFEASRNASDLTAVQDKYQGVLTLRAGSLRLVLAGTLQSRAALEGIPIPFPLPEDSSVFESVRVSGEIAYTGTLLSGSLRAAATLYEKKEIQWEPALAAAFRLGPGRLSLALSFEDFPGRFNYTLSWRLVKN